MLYRLGLLVRLVFCLFHYPVSSLFLLVAQSCPTLRSHVLVAHQAPLAIGFPGKNTGVGCSFLLQGIFLTQGSNCIYYIGRWILSHGATSVTHDLGLKQQQNGTSKMLDSPTPNKALYRQIVLVASFYL